MAEGWNKTVPCRFFAKGSCREGPNCRYAHIRRRNPEQSSSHNNRLNGAGPSQSFHQKPICRYYNRGTCLYGNNCRFAHDSSQIPPISNRTHLMSSSSWNVEEERDNLNSENTIAEETRTQQSITSTHYHNSEDWANAPEFIPSPDKNIPTSTSEEAGKTYAEALNIKSPKTDNELDIQNANAPFQLCPYLQTGECKYGEECRYHHGEICDLCGCACLNPFDEEQRKQHVSDCIKQHEKDMELSFAIARSKEKQCGICFEVVMEKTQEKRFGILPNCIHCYCLECIRRWRQSPQFEHKIIRSCPECRITSDFVCPSLLWVDGKEEKEQLIKDYKIALSMKPCKYFKCGEGKCPFGNKCFYLHAFPDGTKTDVGPPPRQRRAQGADGDMDFFERFILWDFLGERENRWFFDLEDIEDLVALFSDSEEEDSDLSESEYDFW